MRERGRRSAMAFGPRRPAERELAPAAPRQTGGRPVPIDRRRGSLPYTAGNQAVLRLLEAAQPKLMVGSAFDRCEAEADKVARTVVAALGWGGTVGTVDNAIDETRVSRSSRVGSEGGLADADVEQGIRSASGGGQGLHGPTRARMETAFGADFGGVRLHTGPQVDRLNDDLQSHAFTLGSHVYVRSSQYRPGTASGDELLAHELTHTLQQGGAGVRRSSIEPAVRVTQRAPNGMVALKRKKMHLDFVRMKRDNTRLGKAFASQMAKLTGLDWLKPAKDPNDPRTTGSYGHWWTEVGNLTEPAKKEKGNFAPMTSYGWYPNGGAAGKSALKGVPGILNAGSPSDPHEGEPAKHVFHPVMEVDDTEDYDTVRDRVSQRMKTFATGFTGSWSWKLGWGKNCHTFQQALKTNVGLHYTKASAWLLAPSTQEREAKQADLAEAMLANAEEVHDFAGPGTFGVCDENGKSAGGIRPPVKIGVTGNTRSVTWGGGGKGTIGEIIANGETYWCDVIDYEGSIGTPYPGQPSFFG